VDRVIARPYSWHVAPPATRLELAAPIQTWEDDDTFWVRIGPDLAIPSKFHGKALLAHPRCEVQMVVEVLSHEGVPVIDELRVLRDKWANRHAWERHGSPVGPPITPGLLHDAAISELQKRMVANVAQKIVNREDIGVGVFSLARDLESGAPLETLTFYGGRPAKQGRGRDTTDERLQHVAEIYKAAVAAGESPVMAVAKQLPCSRPTAGRLVKQARQRGYLPPTTPGKVAT
jgi:hypothetical protein